MSNPKDTTNEAQLAPGTLSDHATRVARKVFAKRGSHSEAHVSEVELAVIVEAAITTDPVRSDLLAACEAAESFLRGLVPMYMASDDEEVLQAAERLSTAIAAARGGAA